MVNHVTHGAEFHKRPVKWEEVRIRSLAQPLRQQQKALKRRGFPSRVISGQKRQRGARKIKRREALEILEGDMGDGQLRNSFFWKGASHFKAMRNLVCT